MRAEGAEGGKRGVAQPAQSGGSPYGWMTRDVGIEREREQVGQMQHGMKASPAVAAV